MSPPVTPQRVDLFGILSPAEWRRACPTLTLRDLHDRQPIYHQGELCRQIFLIVKGHVTLTRINPQGEAFTLAILTKGELFGPISEQAEGEMPESAVAKGEVQLYQIPMTAFQTLLDRHPLLAKGVIHLLSLRQRFLERRIEGLLFQDVQARLAETLKALAGRQGERCSHGFETHIQLTQQELADLVGTGRPVVSTLLNRLRERGIVAYDRDFLCINQIDALERLISS
jgi:CRP-like cAMP-binding protein